MAAEQEPLLGQKQPKSTIRFIQGFRAFAIAWIVIHHYLYVEGDSSTGAFLGIGHSWDASSIADADRRRFLDRTPLALFTVLSGFLTHQIHSRREDVEGMWGFFCRRLSKLVVMYYSTELLVFVLVIVHLGVNDAGSREVIAACAHLILDLLGLNVWLTPVALLIPEHEAAAVKGGFLVAFIREGMPDTDGCRSWLYPLNGPLWYVQALLFCWFSYPLLGHFFKTEKGNSRLVTVFAIFALGILALVPAFIPFFVEVSWQYDVFLHNFPLFFLPVFYVGVAVSELGLQESWESESNEAWTHFKTRWSTLVAELLFVGLTFVVFLVVPYPFRIHNYLWCVVYGFIIFFFTLGDAGENLTIGIRFLLESDVSQVLGDASFCIFALQEPVAVVFYWIFGEHGIGAQYVHHHQWMNPLIMLCYLLVLYPIGLAVSRYFDGPLTTWVQDQVVNPLFKKNGSSSAKAV